MRFLNLQSPITKVTVHTNVAFTITVTVIAEHIFTRITIVHSSILHTMSPIITYMCHVNKITTYIVEIIGELSKLSPEIFNICIIFVGQLPIFSIL